VKVDNFEISFYDKICEKFNDCIKIAKEDEKGLSISVRVVEAYDKNLRDHGKL
jgi:hypothetical protein